MSEVEKAKITRRKYLKYGGGVVAAAVLAAAGYGIYEATRLPPTTPAPTPTTTPAPTPTTTRAPTPTTTPAEIEPFPAGVDTLVWTGVSTGMLPVIADEYKRLTGIDFKYTILTQTDVVAKILAVEGRGIDVASTDTSIWLALAEHMPPVVQATPVDKLPWYKWEDLAKEWREPEKYFGAMFGKENSEYLAYSAILPMMWYGYKGPNEPGEYKKKLYLPPRVYNFDSVCWNPEFIDHEVTSWGELFNREYKGKVGVQDIFPIAMNHFTLYLVNSGQMSKPEIGINNPTRKEIDTVIDFLISQKKAGQIKAFWPEYGSAVNLHVTRDIWISDGWQPVEYDVRAAGCPAYYAECEEGYRNWYLGDAATTGNQPGTPRYDAAMHWINWCTFGGFDAVAMVRKGYFACNYPSPRVKDYMGPEFWDWHYAGKRTYKPIDEAIKAMFPDRPEFLSLPERLQQALFFPPNYPWSKTEGQPHPKGCIRDAGQFGNEEKATFDRHMYRVGTFQIWPKEADYMAAAWDRMKSA